jgi:hypothetical protein
MYYKLAFPLSSITPLHCFVIHAGKLDTLRTLESWMSCASDPAAAAPDAGAGAGAGAAAATPAAAFGLGVPTGGDHAP